MRVGSPEEALRELTADPGARVLAGGTLLMQGADAGCARLVDITDAGLHTIDKVGDDWVIGAAAPVARLLDHQLPEALTDAADRFGPPAIRQVATVGGNLMGAGSFGHLAPALLALDARVRWLETTGVRETPVREVWHSFPRPSGLLTHVIVSDQWAWSGLDQIERTALDHWVCVLALAVGPDGPVSDRRWGVGAATALPTVVQGDRPDGVTTFDDHQASAEYRRAMLSVVADRLIDRRRA